MNQYVFREENFEELYRNYEKIEIKECIICHSDKFTKWTKESRFQAYKCNDCALIFMNPQLSEEGLNKYYNDYIGRRRVNNKLKMEQRNLQYKLDYNKMKKVIYKEILIKMNLSNDDIIKNKIDDVSELFLLNLIYGKKNNKAKNNFDIKKHIKNFLPNDMKKIITFYLKKRRMSKICLQYPGILEINNFISNYK